MEIVPVSAGGPGLEQILQDYRRRYDLSEATVLNTLLGALASRRAQALMVLRAGRPVGAVVVGQRGPEGLLRLWHVLEGETAAAEALLQRAEELLAASGALHIEGSLPLLPDGPLERALRQRGYRVTPRARMVLDLVDGALPALSLPHGYRLGPWYDSYQVVVAGLLSEAHRDSADAALYPELAGPEGQQRLLERVHAGQFGRFDHALAPMVQAGTELAGLSLNVWHAVLPSQGFILDLAVAAAHRRRGLGRALVAASAHAFHEAGAPALGLAVTLANRPAVSLYEAMGFRVEQHFSIVHKDLGVP